MQNNFLGIAVTLAKRRIPPTPTGIKLARFLHANANSHIIWDAKRPFPQNYAPASIYQQANVWKAGIHEQTGNERATKYYHLKFDQTQVELSAVRDELKKTRDFKGANSFTYTVLAKRFDRICEADADMMGADNGGADPDYRTIDPRTIKAYFDTRTIASGVSAAKAGENFLRTGEAFGSGKHFGTADAARARIDIIRIVTEMRAQYGSPGVN